MTRKVTKKRFILHLDVQHRYNDPDGMLRLRAVLKLLLRSFGFRCKQIDYPTAESKQSEEPSA